MTIKDFSFKHYIINDKPAYFIIRVLIELFFGYFKRTLKAIHLLNIYENGVTIKFYMVMPARGWSLNSSPFGIAL